MATVTAESYFNEGITWHNLKEYDKAIENYTSTIQLDPNNKLAYYNRGLAWSTKDYDKAIEDYSKTIQLDPDYKLAYYSRAYAWFMKKEYDKSIEDYSQAIRIDPDYMLAYVGRGWLYYCKNQYDKAMEDFNKAIQLDPDYDLSYNNRGAIWLNNKDFDKALEDFNRAIFLNPGHADAYKSREDYEKAIQLNPDYIFAYNNRGLAWFGKKEYDKAIEAFTQAIQLNRDYTDAYNNRGASWADKKEFDKAIADYNTAIRLNPADPNVYNNRGLAWYNKAEYEKALDDFNKSLELNPDSEYAKYWRDLTKTRIGELIKFDEAKPEASLYFLNSAVKDLQEEERKKIISLGVNTIEIVDRIRKYAFAIPDGPVAHYTKLKVADILTSADESRMRYYNVVYMNDPEEGKVLLECLDDQDIENSFKAGRLEEENNVYLGSFLPASHEDDLVMWRTYGKDEKNMEAAGCSIVIDINFFDKDGNYLQPQLRPSSKKDDEPVDDNKNVFGQSLYRVLYYDRRQKRMVEENGNTVQKGIDDLVKSLRELISLKDVFNPDAPINSVINRIIYRVLSELRYLFKSSDYVFENELRVIQYVTSEKKEVQIDDNGGQWLPRRLYIESNKTIQKSIKKIILGPKVPNPSQWVYLEVSMKKSGHSVELKRSECKFQ